MSYILVLENAPLLANLITETLEDRGHTVMVKEAALTHNQKLLELQATLRETNQTLCLLSTFRYRRLDKASALAVGLAHACPDPVRAVMGLQELLTNAAEHGNLHISYQDNPRLILDGRGIAMARQMSFDGLRYIGRGNRVIENKGRYLMETAIMLMNVNLISLGKKIWQKPRP